MTGGGLMNQGSDVLVAHASGMRRGTRIGMATTGTAFKAAWPMIKVPVVCYK
jgi:hypothetical protein